MAVSRQSVKNNEAGWKWAPPSSWPLILCHALFRMEQVLFHRKWIFLQPTGGSAVTSLATLIHLT